MNPVLTDPSVLDHLPLKGQRGEFVRLLSKLRDAGEEDGSLVVCLTSALSGEGTSTVAAQFAASAAALASALESGQLAGAGLDVLSSEPPAPDNPLIGAKNCFVTPHLAWATKASRERLMAISVDNLRGFLDGEPRNVVNQPG